MKKKELIKRYETLCERKKIYIASINLESDKSTLKNAIDCLECSDESLEEYFEEFGKIYRGSWLEMCKRGDFKTHSNDRFDVYMSIKWERKTERERELGLQLSIYEEISRRNNKKNYKERWKNHD